MFSKPEDFFTPELKALVSNKKTPLTQVLSLPYFSKASRLGFPQLNEYLSYHSEELLLFTFTDDNSSLSASAYSCLLTGQAEILKPLFTNEILLTKAIDLLGNKNTKEYLIGRLASLTLVCLGALDESIFEQCTFIFSFLQYCTNPSVFNFLSKICGDKDKYLSKLQVWLNNLHFYEYVFAEFDRIDYNYKFTKSLNENIDTTVYKEPHANTCLCLYNLLSCCCTNENLKKGFLNEKLIEILLRKFNANSKSESEDFVPPPDFIRSARWKAITASTQKEISSQLVRFLPEAIELLTEDFEKLRSYRSSALDFITKMLYLEPSATYETVMKSNMTQTLILLIMKFPNSSIFLSSFKDFVEAALTIPQFGVVLINIYLPIIISHSPLCDEGQSDDRKLTMDDFSDMKIGETNGKNDVNNIEVLFYDSPAENPIQDTLYNIIESLGIKQRHRKKKTLSRMIRHMFKKHENKVAEFYKDKPKGPTFNRYGGSSEQSGQNDKNEIGANEGETDETDLNENLNEEQNSDEKEKKYNIDGDLDLENENPDEEKDSGSNKRLKDNDPRRIVVGDADKNDPIRVLDNSETIPIAQNRIIQTYFMEIADMFQKAASKNNELNDALKSVAMYKEYINGPVKKYINECRPHSSNIFKNLFE